MLFEVIKREFETPESIAYIEEFKGGLLHYSYYISLQCPYRREIQEYYQGPLQGNEALMTAFAQLQLLYEKEFAMKTIRRECNLSHK